MSAAPTSTSLRQPSEDATEAKHSYHLGFSYVKRKREAERRATELQIFPAGETICRRRRTPPRPLSAALAPSLSGAHRSVAASRLRVRLYRGCLYKLACHAPRALHSSVPMASLRPICRAPLRQLTSRFPPSIAPRAPLRQWRGYATTLDAQQKVPSTSTKL